MSEPDRAEIGRSMGDNKGDNIEDDAAACCAATGTARPPEFPGRGRPLRGSSDQGQVGYRGSQIQLEPGLEFGPALTTNFSYTTLETGPESPGWEQDHGCPSRTAQKLAAADNKGDNIEDDAAACCAATGTARPPEFPGHQGQVGYRGSQIQLEPLALPK